MGSAPGPYSKGSCVQILVSIPAFFFLRAYSKMVPQSIKLKVKVTLEQAMKAQRGSRGIDLFFL
jgi:hypothetical protein